MTCLARYPTSGFACMQMHRDYQEKITWTAGGNPVDLSGMTMRADFRFDDGELAFSLATGDGITITDAAAGKFELTKPADEMDFGDGKTIIMDIRIDNVDSFPVQFFYKTHVPITRD